MRPSRHTFIILFLFIILHAPLFIYDVLHPDAALNADRARIRLEKILFVLKNESLDALPELRVHPIYQDSLRGSVTPDRLSRLAALGLPGDYLFHGVLLTLFGLNGLIMVQLALALASILAVRLIAITLTLPEGYGLVIAIGYMLLPPTIVHPHQLVTEAIVNPLIIIMTYHFLLYLSTRSTCRFRTTILMASLLPMLRPQFMALSLLLGAILWWLGGDIRRAMAFCFVPLIVMATWMAFVWSQTGSFGLGRSEFGLAHNLFSQAQRIATISGLAFDERGFPTRELSLADYVRFVVAHPWEWLTFRLTENINMFLNTGLNQLVGDYLGMERFDPRGGGGGPLWHELRGRLTLVQLVERMFEEDRLWLVTFLVASALWGGVLAMSAGGAYLLIRERECDKGIKAVVVATAAYGVLSAQPALLRPAHRSAVDFLIVIAAGMFLRRCVQGWHVARKAGRA